PSLCRFLLSPLSYSSAFISCSPRVSRSGAPRWRLHFTSRPSVSSCQPRSERSCSSVTPDFVSGSSAHLPSGFPIGLSTVVSPSEFRRSAASSCIERPNAFVISLDSGVVIHLKPRRHRVAHSTQLGRNLPVEGPAAGSTLPMADLEL